MAIFARNQLAAPIRKALLQLSRNFPPRTESVLHVGCKNGELLLEYQDRFARCVGIDEQQSAIDAAQHQLTQMGFHHLSFNAQPAMAYLHDLEAEQRFDLIISTLYLHTLPLDQAVTALQAMCKQSKWVLVVDYIEPESRWQRLRHHVALWFAGTLDRYLDYRDAGEMHEMIAVAGQAFCHYEQLHSSESLAIWLIKTE